MSGPPMDASMDSMDEELRELIALEKSTSATPPMEDARARLESRLSPLFAAHAAAAIAGASAGAGAAAGAGAGAGAGIEAGIRAAGHAATWAERMFRWPALAVAMSTGIVAGSAGTAAVIRATSEPAPPKVEVRYVDRIIEVQKSVDAGVVFDISDLPAVTPPSPEKRNSPIPDKVPETTESRGGGSDQDLVRERQLVDTARSALARHDATAALAAIDEHARTYARGQLVEMREALAVQALAQAGRVDDAKSRAARFHAKFPGSLYGAIVDGAVGSTP